ncbi:hypothetical protein [Alsobacter soli]|nr:hypothetical protein [Alsobacter soli]
MAAKPLFADMARMQEWLGQLRAALESENQQAGRRILAEAVPAFTRAVIPPPASAEPPPASTQPEVARTAPAEATHHDREVLKRYEFADAAKGVAGIARCADTLLRGFD